MANIYTIRDRSLNCDVCAFISDDHANASALLVNYALQRPAASRALDLICIGQVPLDGDFYQCFGLQEHEYVRSYVEPKGDENGKA